MKNITSARNRYKGINPDECVAIGRCDPGRHPGRRPSARRTLLLLDVTPLSLGIETMGGVFTRLIDAQHHHPDVQEEPDLLHGVRQPAFRWKSTCSRVSARWRQYNKSLGKLPFGLVLPRLRRGVPQIEVTFDIDANGIVHVSAKDLGTGKEQHITITSSTNMSKEDIEKAVKDAEQYAAEDAKIKEGVEVRNTADQAIYQSEKTLAEMADKISADDKNKIETALNKLKETVKGDDIAAIKTDTEALQQAFYAVSEQMYKNVNPDGAAQAGAGTAGDGAAQNGGQYYDADYKVVDEDENKNNQ